MSFGNMQKMLKQVQKMQADMAKVQEELAVKTVEVGAGGGAVKVIANGQMELEKLQIDPAAVDPEDIELLEDLLLAAVNEALRKAREMVSEEMGKVTGGMKIPGLF